MGTGPLLYLVASQYVKAGAQVEAVLDTSLAAWIVVKRRKPPEIPPSLGEMVHLIAGFGGFLGRQSDGHPAPKAIWEGMQRVQAFAMGIAAAKEAFIPLADLWAIGW